jgi:aminocarboxymuconate-semialdehyde decarboxylase
VVVDVHAHVIVPEILRDAAPREGWRPRVWREDGAQLVELEGRPIRSAVNEFVDVEAILAHGAETGVDAVLLCPWVPLLFPAVEPAAALERCRIQNDSLAAITRAHPGRVAALGAVPLQDPAVATSELENVLGAGLAGVETPASVGGAYLGDPRFEPFWEAAASREALVFIHPTTRGFQDPAFAEHYLWNTVGNPLETTVCAAQMTMAGVMERHPRLRVLLAHGGGALPVLRGRLRHAHSFQPDAAARLRESPSESIRRFYFDTVTHDTALLRALIDFAGADRVLLGTDYPFDMADPDPLTRIRACGLSAADEVAVVGGNAARLLDLDRADRQRSAAGRADHGPSSVVSERVWRRR